MSTSAARSLERDFDEQLYIGGEARSQQPSSQQHYAKPPSSSIHSFKNGLPTYKPVIYPNPGIEDSSSSEEEDVVSPQPRVGNVHVASSFRRATDPLPPRPSQPYYSTSCPPYKPEIASSVAVGSYPQRIGQHGIASSVPKHPEPYNVHNESGQHSYANVESVRPGITNSPSTHSYASIHSRDQDSLFDDEEYLPPPVPNQVTYGSIQAQNIKVADTNYKPPPIYQVPAYKGSAYSPGMAGRPYVPQSASSRLVYTTNNKQGGYAESRPMHGGTEAGGDSNPVVTDSYTTPEAHISHSHSYDRSATGHSGVSSLGSPSKKEKSTDWP